MEKEANRYILKGWCYMDKGELLYEGKAKKIYATTSQERVLVEFKDDATAFDGLKKEKISSKGSLNNSISTIFFELLEREGVATHFLYKLSATEMLAKKLEIIPVEVIVRNFAAGSLSKRLGLEEGKELGFPVLEFCLKDDDLHDPMLNHYHIYAMELATPLEMQTIEKRALRINEILQPFLQDNGLQLIDFKLEFGRFQGEIILGDEITPDTCRFWDTGNGRKLDKDLFRNDSGDLTEAYREILHRLKT